MSSEGALSDITFSVDDSDSVDIAFDDNGDSCRAFTTLDKSLVSKLHEYYQQSDSDYRNLIHECKKQIV